MKYPTSVTQTKSSAIVACDEGYGLLEFSAETLSFGNIIKRGSFSGVACESGRSNVYALECNTEKLMVFQKKENADAWICIREVILDYTKSSNQDTLLVNREKIFVSATRSKCVFILGNDGGLLNMLK